MPAEATDSFSSSDRRQQDASPELYDRFGRARSDDAAQAGQEPQKATGEQPANGETGALAAKEAQDEAGTTEETAEEKAEQTAATQDDEALSPEQEEQLRALQLRDREVRLHEQQHAGVGGQHAGAPSYEYETGPDGKQYAVEGEVQIDLSPIADDPRATIDKMQQIKAAALAPAEPSQADKNAAARADQYILEAQAELQQPASAETKGNAAGRSTEEPKGTQGTDAVSKTSLPPTQAAVPDPMVVRNQVIAGVYGKAAQAESRSLLNLA
ncbi:MAG: hypothetical protein GYB38_06505 [Gammaproteobacteria bacterium]|nr:hypothetical protein [Gammaproteobacteria bacterium]